MSCKFAAQLEGLVESRKTHPVSITDAPQAQTSKYREFIVAFGYEGNQAAPRHLEFLDAFLPPIECRVHDSVLSRTSSVLKTMINDAIAAYQNCSGRTEPITVTRIVQAYVPSDMPFMGLGHELMITASEWDIVC
jgi:hypothetical protein